MTTTTKEPQRGGNRSWGEDQNPREEPITMKTTSPRLAHTADNLELASSGGAVLVSCDEESCTYYQQGHYADGHDPICLHRYVRVSEAQFSVSIERLSMSKQWELSVEMRDETFSPDQARLLSRALAVCATITDSLNRETETI